MKIHHLEISNFRSFEHKTFRFSDQFTLLVGGNGTGKTTVLEALAVGVGSLFLGFDSVTSRPIRNGDVPWSKSGVRQIKKPIYPVSISCEGTVNEQKILWTRSIEKNGGRTTRKQAHQIIDVSEQLQERVRKGKDVVLPLIAYYGADRFWLQNRVKSVEPLKPGSRTLGYVNCFNPTLSERQLLRWCKTMELGARQQREPMRVFEAFKSAISNCTEDLQGVTYDLCEDELLVTTTDRRTLPSWMLNNGVRNILAVVADIAYRAVVLNPQLEREATKHTPGLVLIDEIDLHLDSKSQQRFVQTLQYIFPKLQVVASTYSPSIVDSVHPKDRLDLEPLGLTYALPAFRSNVGSRVSPEFSS